MIEESRIARILPGTRLMVQLLLVGFFLWYVVCHWREVVDIVQRLSPSTLWACASVYCASHLLACGSTTRLTALLGYRIRYRDVANMYFRYLPAKYLPGGIWHAVGRGGSLIGYGVSKVHAAHIVLLEQALAIWWSGLLGLSLALLAFADMRSVVIALLLIWIACSGIVMKFTLHTRFAAMGRLAMDPILGVVYISGWIVLATAFCLYLLGSGLVEAPILQITAGYLLSWMMGAIAFFAPQGLGVFELAMTRTLELVGNESKGLLWLIGSYRLVVLTADLFVWATWALWNRTSMLRSRWQGDGQ